MTAYIFFGFTLILVLPVAVVLSIYVVDALFERSWHTLNDNPEPQDELLRKLDMYGNTIDALWAKAIDQLNSEVGKHQELRYWIPSLDKLRESDRQLFVKLKHMKQAHLHRVVALLVDTGLVAFAEELEKGTPTTLILKGLKKGNAAIAAGIENLGYVARKSFAWIKTFCETKEKFLENLVGEVEKSNASEPYERSSTGELYA